MIFQLVSLTLQNFEIIVGLEWEILSLQVGEIIDIQIRYTIHIFLGKFKIEYLITNPQPFPN